MGEAADALLDEDRFTCRLALGGRLRLGGEEIDDSLHGAHDRSLQRESRYICTRMGQLVACLDGLSAGAEQLLWERSAGGREQLLRQEQQVPGGQVPSVRDGLERAVGTAADQLQDVVAQLRRAGQFEGSVEQELKRGLEDQEAGGRVPAERALRRGGPRRRQALAPWAGLGGNLPQQQLQRLPWPEVVAKHPLHTARVGPQRRHRNPLERGLGGSPLVDGLGGGPCGGSRIEPCRAGAQEREGNAPTPQLGGRIEHRAE